MGEVSNVLNADDIKRLEPIDAFLSLNVYLYEANRLGEVTEAAANRAQLFLLRYFNCTTEEDVLKLAPELITMYNQFKTEILKYVPKFQICILKASGEFWYSDHIGEVYSVFGEIDGDYYTRADGSMLVVKEDCGVIS